MVEGAHSHFHPLDRGDEQNRPISPNGAPEPGRLYEVPARCGRAVRLHAGQRLTIINTHGSQVCDFWAFATVDLCEFVSMAHFHAVASKLTPAVGDGLTSNRRRPLLTLMEDTSPGVHDTLIAACDTHRYEQLGARGYHENCSDNLRNALAAIGVRVPVVPAPFNIWMNTPPADDGSISWRVPVSRSGDRLVLRADADVIAVMSACPQDLVPINGEDQIPKSVAFRVDWP
ncbi:Uncharacterized conserved protein YcgI, DUF1989 family [Chelatococcus sambhunathii]|uniref:Uncharacterized conserved protein YcgI, DUF1989 family n=1 Tax=Chelatococcus sambhunathii TaxID=363953 RepID=A0ABM9U9X8_9HYPH|nr:urea carboxylase-associated family protein [Chelatococcus sambhunathii]CUA91195.1 Uncharacterized conserved protein YcgI, DUF1989 family [Chelatococcus sambhunathii]